MGEVKRFRIIGEIVKPKLFTPMKFMKEIPATKRSHAIERIYADLGSRHRAKRHEIRILRVEEVESAEEPTGREGDERPEE